MRASAARSILRCDTRIVSERALHWPRAVVQFPASDGGGGCAAARQFGDQPDAAGVDGVHCRAAIDVPHLGHPVLEEGTDGLKDAGIHISMDGKGRWMENVFIERLWRSLKYEQVYLAEYATGSDARAGIGWWIEFYNKRRPHSSLGDRTPDEAYNVGVTPRPGLCLGSDTRSLPGNRTNVPGGPLPRIGNCEGRSRSTTSDDGAAKAIRRGMATRAAPR